MKIHPSLPTPPVPAVAAESRSPERAERTDDRSTRVSLSDDARFVASVADEIRKGPEVRADVVAATKAALADGSFERTVDFDRMFERLLADL